MSSLRPHPWVIAVSLLVVAVTTQLALAHLYGRVEVGGEAHWLVSDDAMIAQRYAWNFVRGNGLVLNPGERVEGFTNPLMVLAVAAPVELMAAPRAVGLWIWILHALLQGLIVVLIAGLGSDSGPTRARVVMAGVYLALPHHGFFASAGLSVYAQGLALVLIASRWRRGGRLFWLAFALYPLVHGVCLPLWLALAAARLSSDPDRWRRELARLGAAALPLATYVGFRLAYYGELLPNTFYLRSGGVLALGDGLLYLAEAAAWLAPLLVLGAALLTRVWGSAQRRAAQVALVLLPFFAYVATLGGDNHPWHRFVLPLAPVLCWSLGSALVAAAPAARRLWLPAGVLLLAQLGLSAYGFSSAHGLAMATRAWLAQRVEYAYAIDANAQPDDVVALFSLGHLSYFSKRRVIDMLGRADYAIARTPPKPWRKPAHQKDDPAGVMARAPAYVQCRVPHASEHDLAALERQAQGWQGYDANLARDPSFRSAYVPVTLGGREIEIYGRRGQAATVW